MRAAQDEAARVHLAPHMQQLLKVLGELMAQEVSGYGTYEQLGKIAESLPLPF